MKKWLAKSLITALLGVSVASFAVAETEVTGTTTDTTGTQMNSTETTNGTMDSSTMTSPSATTTESTTTTTTTPTATMDTNATTAESTMEKKHHGNGKHHKMSKTEIMMMPAADVKWVDAPASAGLGEGIQIAYLDQHNLRASAPFAFLVKIPANSKEQPHYHPAKMQGVIMSGTYYLGTGKEFDESKGMALPAGSFYTVPAKKSHYGWTQEETVILVHSMGPWSTRMVSANGEHAGKKHHKNGTTSEKNNDNMMNTGDATTTTQPAAGTTDTTGTGSNY